MKRSLKIVKGNIPGFTHYYISKMGRLYSNYRGDWREIKGNKKDNGYISNILWGDDGKKKNIYRHRLVAMIYLPNPENKPQVCHRDNNPENNKLSNLYWGTPEDNMAQCIKDDRFYYIGYEKSKAMNVNIKLIIKDYISGMPRKELLVKHNISTGYLYKTLRNNNVKLRKPIREHSQ